MIGIDIKEPHGQLDIDLHLSGPSVKPQRIGPGATLIALHDLDPVRIFEADAGDFVKGDHIPQPGEPYLTARHVVEQVDLVRERKAVRDAAQALQLSTEAFLDAANDWRDPLAAKKGKLQQAEFEKADAELKAQLEG